MNTIIFLLKILTGCFLIILFFLRRFPIAIKTLLNADAFKIDTILDEAKTMLHIGKYHDHIVNLQGITYEIGEQKTPEVSIILCISN